MFLADIDDISIDTNWGVADFRVYMCLSRHRENTWSRTTRPLTANDIATHTQLTARSVRRALKHLEDCNAIVPSRKHKHAYVLPFAAVKEGAPPTQPAQDQRSASTNGTGPYQTVLPAKPRKEDVSIEEETPF